MRLARLDVRDHIKHSKTDCRRSYRFYRPSGSRNRPNASFARFSKPRVFRFFQHNRPGADTFSQRQGLIVCSFSFTTPHEVISFRLSFLRGHSSVAHSPRFLAARRLSSARRSSRSFGSTSRVSICPAPIDKCNHDKGGYRDLAGESGEQAVAFSDETLVRNAAFGIARKFWFQPIEKEHFV